MGEHWLLSMLREPAKDEVKEPIVLDGISNGMIVQTVDKLTPGDHYAASNTWEQILEADGWIFHHRDPNDTVHWTRPGKEKRDGSSATTNHKGSKSLHVFTTSVAGLDADTAYTKFGYYAATRHGGDMTAAAKALAAQFPNSGDDMDAWTRHLEAQRGIADGDGVISSVYLNLWRIDWEKFWLQDHSEEQWLCEPLLAKGKQHAIYAGAKTGKSLVMLEICAALATGRAVLKQAAGKPIRILYVDYEMTAADVQERLRTFGYTEDDDLSNLHYILLPSIAGIDTKEGGQIVIEAAKAWEADLVVVDTTSRAVEGPENDADTFRAVYRHTGLGLKAAGITFARLDHSGKDLSRGQRGSSAKNDDVDIVWQLSAKDDGVKKFTATHRRVMWVDECFEITVEVDEEGIERSVVTEEAAAPAGTAACIKKMDDLGLPFTASNVAAYKAAKAAGITLGAGNVVQAAVKERKTPEYQMRKYRGLL